MKRHRIERILAGALVALATAAVSWTAAGPARAGDDAGSELSRRLKSMPPEEQLAFLRGQDASAEVSFQMGNAFFSLDQLDSAIVYYQHAIDGDSTYAKAWVNMGLAYDGQHQASAAERAFKNALEIDPRDVLALCHMGFNQFSRGETSKAIDYYLQALSIDPNSAQAHYNLGLAFADARIFREALIEWEKVVELDDGDLGRTAAENVELIRTYMELDGK